MLAFRGYLLVDGDLIVPIPAFYPCHYSKYASIPPPLPDMPTRGRRNASMSLTDTFIYNIKNIKPFTKNTHQL